MSNFFDDDDDIFSDNKSKKKSDDFDFSDNNQTDPFAFGDSNSEWEQPVSNKKNLIENLPKPPMWAWISVGAVAAVVVGGLVVSSLFGGGSEIVAPLPSPSASESMSESPSASPTPDPTGEIDDVDLFKQPANFESFIDEKTQSLVEVECRDWRGSGFSITVSGSDVTNIITNHHVIDTCLDGSGIFISQIGSDTKYSAILINYDEEQDLAHLTTDADVPPVALVTASDMPKAGQWAMALGSPGSAIGVLEGAVTTGQVTQVGENWVVSDVTINPGNSGGPLFNSKGQVIGVNTFEYVEEGFNNSFYASSVIYMCSFFVDCP